ncbi:MAG: signal recognition particle protein [Bdellovibrionales bacterium]
MFQNLSDKVLGSIAKLRTTKITEAHLESVLKEIRMALLEADVNFMVVKKFMERVKEQALGEAVLKSVTPDQQFTKIVNDELVRVLGGETFFIDLKKTPSQIMLVGLQGVGKTTTAGKLSIFIKKKFKKTVGLIPLDLQRPAAVEQLKILAKQTDTPFYDADMSLSPVENYKLAQKWAEQNNIEVLVLDTAGRLQIDESLMTELKELKALSNPSEVLLVSDAMLGQQSVSVAEGFDKTLGLTGLVLTKFDGDARGGAALSIREATGVPIKLIGTGEKLSALEIFHPDRLASRILDRGDVVSLVEKAQEVVDQKEAMESAKKMSKGQFTVEDFLKQLHMMKKMGGLTSIMGMLPGAGQMMKQMKGMAPPEDEMKKIEAIINSMTRQERKNHKVLNGSRRLRIAKGSGTRVQDVNKFVKQFEQSQKMMTQMMKMGGKKGGNPMGGLPF